MNPRVIVCPIELSSAPGPAFAYALSLARWHEAELRIVHVRPHSRRTGQLDTVDRDWAPLMDTLAAPSAQGATVMPVVLTGNPVRAIADYVRRQSADLLVLPADAPRRSRYWPFDGFAATLSRAVECASITVPEATPPIGEIAPFRNVVCAVDFSPASLSALETALTLAQQAGGRLTLLHALEGFPYETVYTGFRAFRLMHEYRALVDASNRRLRSLVPMDASHWCEVDAVTVTGEPHHAICTVAAEAKADLVTMGVTRRRRRLERLVVGSTVDGVLRRAACPVLTTPGSATVASGVLPTWDTGIDSKTLEPRALGPSPWGGSAQEELSW
jgi:nucleotide-binding universal stress UspA family protein